MIIVKIHDSSDGKKIIALCDDDILGKSFEEGEKLLDLKSGFYDGKRMPKEEIIDNTQDRNFHVNAVGKESVEFCISRKIINKDNVMTISDIPYAQAVIVKE